MRFWPASLGPDGWAELVDATLDTVAMSIVAVVIAARRSWWGSSVPERRGAVSHP